MLPMMKRKTGISVGDLEEHGNPWFSSNSTFSAATCSLSWRLSGMGSGIVASLHVVRGLDEDYHLRKVIGKGWVLTSCWNSSPSMSPVLAQGSGDRPSN